MNELINRIIKIHKTDQPKIKISKSHGTYQYYVNDHYVSKKRIDYVKKLVIEEYYDKLIRDIKQYIRKCDELLKLLDDAFLDRAYYELCDGKRELLDDALYLPIAEQIRKFEAETTPYEKPPYEITTEIYTIKGEHVRSKSEKIIADELYRRKIPYKYEKPLELHSRRGKIIVYPDFTIMNKTTGKIFILEHFGLVSNDDYRNHTFQKLSLYENNGFLLGKNMIFLHETNEEPLNIKILNSYIDEYLV